METQTAPTLNLFGQKVALGPLRRELLPLYTKWINDFEAIQNLGRTPRPLTAGEQEAWFERMTKSETNATFTVYERATGRPLGNAGLHDLHGVDRAAVFGIALLEKDCWDKGFGTETTRLVLRYGFRHLGLHTVHLTVLARNARAIKAYTRAGFKHAGVRREAVFRDGQFHDLVVMDCLARELEAQAA